MPRTCLVSISMLVLCLCPTVGASRDKIDRSNEIESLFLQSSDWHFFHDLDDLSSQARAILESILGDYVAPLGRTMYIGEIGPERGGASSVFLYAAESEKIIVIVTYNNFGIVGPKLLVNVVDRTSQDRCEYNFDTRRMIPSVSDMQEAVKNGPLAASSRCRYKKD